MTVPAPLRLPDLSRIQGVLCHHIQGVLCCIQGVGTFSHGLLVVLLFVCMQICVQTPVEALDYHRWKKSADSARINELLLLSRSLSESRHQQKHKRITDEHENNDVYDRQLLRVLLYALRDVQGQIVQRPEVIQGPDVSQRSSTDIFRLKRKRTNIDEVQMTYKDFWDHLNPFLEKLPRHLRADAPPGLQNMDVVPSIMYPTDHAFAAVDERTISLKFFYIHDLVNAIITYVGQYVTPDYVTWFDDQSYDLEFYMWMIKQPLRELQKELNAQPVSMDDVSLIGSGVGGINPGVQQSIGNDGIAKLAVFVQTMKDIINVPVG